MRNKQRQFLLIIILMFGIIVPTVSAQGDANAGAVVYKNNCGACHGPDMTGGIGSNLAAQEITDTDEEQLLSMVSQGNEENGMPAFQDQITEQELLDVVALLKNPSAIKSLGGGGLTIKEPVIDTSDILPDIFKSLLFVFLWTGVAIVALLVWIKNKK